LSQIKRQIKDPLYRNSLLLMANTVVTSGLGFIFWMVVARLYAEAEVGLGAAIISAMSLLALISGLGLDVSLIRFLPKADKPVDLINSCFTLSGTIAMTAATVFIIGIGLWSPALGFIRENAIFSLAFIVFTISWTLSHVMNSVFIARRRADFALSKSTIYSLLKLPLPIILVLYFQTFGIAASWGIAHGVAVVISLFLFLPRVQNSYRPKPRLTLEVIKNIRRYSTANYFARLLSSAPSLLLPIMIVNLLGAEQNAYFYVAWMIGVLLFSIPASVSQSLFVEGSHFEVDLGVNVRRSFRFIFLLLIPVTVLLFLLGKWLLLAFGAGFPANALTLLWVLVLSSIPLAVNSVYKTILRVTDRMRELMVLSGFTALVVLVGSYFLTAATGILGVGYAWLAAQVLVSVYVGFAMRSRRHTRRA